MFAFDLIIRIVLAPVLIGQALFVRRRVQQLPEPPGPRRGRCGDGPYLRLLIIGDSSAAGVGAESQEAALCGRLVAELSQNFCVDYRLLASTGARTKDGLAWLDGIEGGFDVVLTAFGVNDVTKLTTCATFLEQQSRLWHRLRKDLGAKLILVTAVPPLRHFPALPQPLRWVLGRQGERFQRGLQVALSEYEDCVLLAFDGVPQPGDMAADGFHPGPSAYAAWAKMAAGAILEERPTLDRQRPAP